MAVIKHIAIKNQSYSAAIDYLQYKHDEFTNKPILDEQGRMILRDEFIIEGINCSPTTYGIDCRRTNEKFGKNNTRSEIKAHHYIMSFDPRDRDENGLTPERAQALGMAFAEKNFPGHQVIVCTHPDGHNSAGNIHVHIVLNSVRKLDVKRQDFMERPGDALAGHKHHVTRDFLEYLKAQTMEMCQQESLNQVDLLSPAKVRITDREYWAARRGQQKLNQAFAAADPAPDQDPPTFETQNMFLRRVITDTLRDAASYEEFQKKLLERYGISVHESRGRISYLLPDRTRPIRGSKLGADFEKNAIALYFANREKWQSRSGKIPLREDISKGQRAAQSDARSIRLITDLETCIKAQQSRAYAQKVKVGNLQQMSQTLIFLQENAIGTPEELQDILSSTRADYDSRLAALKSTEAELKTVNSLIHATGQYLSTRAVHAEYLKAKNKKYFREEHYSDLAIYDAALKELRAHYGDRKFMTMKQLKERKTELTAAKNTQYEDFCTARSKRREIQTIAANVKAILGEQQLESREENQQKAASEHEPEQGQNPSQNQNRN